MAKKTTRDGIWTAALSLTRAGNSVDAEKIAEQTGASERTARQCLNVIADTPFLDRSLAPDGSVRYLRGDGISEID